MLVDTHAHIYLDDFADDFAAVLERAREAGVAVVVMPAIDVPSIERAIELSTRHEGLYAMAALHPSAVKDASGADFDRVVELCRDPHVVAIGETGLDYYWDRSYDDKQQRYLRQHIRLSVAVDLPIVFHNREATDDLMRIVREEREACDEPARLRGVFHCFTGSADEAAAVGALGFRVGIGGIMTFKNSGLADAVRGMPLEQIIVETDAPYLTPAPHRGKRNEPAFVRHVAEKIADVKGLSIDEVEDVTTANACEMFCLRISHAKRP